MHGTCFANAERVLYLFHLASRLPRLRLVMQSTIANHIHIRCALQIFVLLLSGVCVAHTDFPLARRVACGLVPFGVPPFSKASVAELHGNDELMRD